MSGKYGVESLKNVVRAACAILNVVGDVVTNFSIWKLFALSAPVAMLKGIDFAAVKQEIGELSTDERKEVEAVFAQNLKLDNQALQAKILAAENYLEEAIVMVGRGVDLVNEGIDLVKRVRAYFGF